MILLLGPAAHACELKSWPRTAWLPPAGSCCRCCADCRRGGAGDGAAPPGYRHDGQQESAPPLLCPASTGGSSGQRYWGWGPARFRPAAAFLADADELRSGSGGLHSSSNEAWRLPSGDRNRGDRLPSGATVLHQGRAGGERRVGVRFDRHQLPRAAAAAGAPWNGGGGTLHCAGVAVQPVRLAGASGGGRGAAVGCHQVRSHIPNFQQGATLRREWVAEKE